MNSRGKPCRPAGRRGEAPVGGDAESLAPAVAASFALPFCAAPFATNRRYSLMQRLDQQLVLGRARAQVRHHRHVDELGQEVIAALQATGSDAAEQGPVDGPCDDFRGAARNPLGMLELIAAAVKDVGQVLQRPVAALLRSGAIVVDLDDEKASADRIVLEEAHRRPAGRPDPIVPGGGALVSGEHPLAELSGDLVMDAEEAIFFAGEAAVEVEA